MSGEIDALSTGMYYSGLQNAQAKAIQDNKKAAGTKKSKFSDLINKQQEVSAFETTGFPPEIQGMTVEDAAKYLSDQFEIAGNELSTSFSTENIQKFKKTVQQFINFVVANNFEINKKDKKGFSHPQQNFSTYNTKIRKKDPRVQIQVINQKLDDMTRAILLNQMDNLKILKQVGEIKGLIIDLMQS